MNGDPDLPARSPEAIRELLVHDRAARGRPVTIIEICQTLGFPRAVTEIGHVKAGVYLDDTAMARWVTAAGDHYRADFTISTGEVILLVNEGPPVYGPADD